LEDPIYTENARKFGSLLTDQIYKPLDRAVWHIEHLIRYPGMIEYIRPPVHDLAWYQYAMLDVLAFLFSLLLLFLFLLYKLIRCVCSRSDKPKVD
jgi:glucuronosyltransferase